MKVVSLNPEVQGSIPWWPTKYFRELLDNIRNSLFLSLELTAWIIFAAVPLIFDVGRWFMVIQARVCYVRVSNNPQVRPNVHF